MNKSRFEDILQQTLRHKHIFGIVANIESADGNWKWISAAGNLTTDTPYFIASTTKLYTASIIFRLCSDKRMSLDDTLDCYFSVDEIRGIHIYKKRDYSSQITVRQLLSQTSGIADYFSGKRPGGSLERNITSGQDQAWTFEDVIRDARSLTAAFPPGARGKALYSDTNYQLLGKIIERVTGENYEAALQQYIFRPLKFSKTYLYSDAHDGTPATMYFKSRPLPIPQAMTSFGPDGGIVSTSEESMRFIKAFFGGLLFPKSIFNECFHWNRIFFPLEYGLGVMRFKLPLMLTGFRRLPELIGHSGLSGAFAYYCPERDVYLTGTVNQIAHPGISYRMMLKLVSAIIHSETR